MFTTGSWSIVIWQLIGVYTGDQSGLPVGF
jgi:hypothetical protein